MEHTAKLIDTLRAIVGNPHVLTGVDTDAFTTDPRQISGNRPLAVVRPRTTDQVAEIVTAGAAGDVAIVTQGAHTGMSGGAQVIGPQPSVIVSLTRMTTIVAVDVADGTATVEAGVTIQAIQEAAAASGLLFAPDWGARGSATIGGGIATNAGGNNVLQYGSMRDHVLGLEVVLHDGRVWDGMRSLLKDSSGYRLRDVFIGSEGTLGVITRAVVKLSPKPHEERSTFVALRDLEAATELLRQVQDSGATVTGFELIPEFGLAGVIERFGRRRPLDARSDWYVLFRVGAPRGVEASDLIGAILERSLASGMVTDAAVAATPEQEANLWLIRDEISPSLLIPNAQEGAKYDTAVPVGRVVEFIRRGSEIVTSLGGADGWRPHAFGHVGDGNIHFYALAPVGSETGSGIGPKTSIMSAIDELVAELGGTLSAEHGVGHMLVDRIATQKSELEIELLNHIKHTFDPDGRFNPGKTLPLRGPRAQ